MPQSSPLSRHHILIQIGALFSSRLSRYILHGTGASSHSWRALAPLLARQFTVIAPDLPGHGFNSAVATNRLSLPGMARSPDRLLRALKVEPMLALGHSAGAAIAVRMCLEGHMAPRALVSLNPNFSLQIDVMR